MDPAPSPDRWSQIRTLLGDARERPEADRAAWLDAATDDTALRAEVRSLLLATSAADTDGFLARPAGPTAFHLLAQRESAARSLQPRPEADRLG